MATGSLNHPCVLPVLLSRQIVGVMEERVECIVKLLARLAMRYLPIICGFRS